MRKIHATYILSIVLTTIISFGLSAAPAPQKRVLTFQQAQKEPKIRATIVGSFSPGRLPNLIDRDGMHYGRCMVAILQNTSNDTLNINLLCGTRLLPANDSSQVMLVTHDVEFPLGPGEEYASKFYAVCVQLHEDPPTSDDEYLAGESADSSLVKLALAIEANYAQNMIGQHAAWAISDTANADVLKDYGANEESIAQTVELLNKAKVSTVLNDSDETPNSWLSLGLRLVIIIFIFSITPYFFRKLLFVIRRKKRRATLPTQEGI